MIHQHHSLRTGLRCLITALVAASPVAAQIPDPWIITDAVTVTEPITVGNVIILGNGSLTVDSVPGPGLVLSGNLWALDDAIVQLRDSVIRFASSYHGQYTLVATDRAQITVDSCDYRVTEGIQHGLVAAGNAALRIQGSQFNQVQLVAMERSTLRASSTDGAFEVILENSAQIELSDIPATPGNGSLWVWVEVPPESHLTYSPPLAGFVEEWTFPPATATGVPSRCTLERCQVLLWPLLVWNDSDLELRDIDEENRVIVGLHLPDSITLKGIANQLTVSDATIPIDDRSIRLVNASVDTWNLYPWNSAMIEVIDCHLGEILAFDDTQVQVKRTLIDGSGGFLGTTGSSRMQLSHSTTTCTIQAVESSTLEMHHCEVLPYPQDPDGSYTRFGAYDNARLLADHTPVLTSADLGGDGVIVVTWIGNQLARLPASAIELTGSIGVFGLETAPQLASWELWASVPELHERTLVSQGTTSIDQGSIATWSASHSAHRITLELVVRDTEGRAVTGWRHVPDRYPRTPVGTLH